jgi:hypothetical protein
MKALLVVSVTLLFPFALAAPERKTPVSVAHGGQDKVGSLFVEAFNRELSHSLRYSPMNGAEEGFRLYMELMTVDAADSGPEQGKKSVMSVVIEEMGQPNSFPVPDMWYHKVIVVKRGEVDQIAKDLLDDMDARLCSYSKNSNGGCTKEKFEPKISRD